ncbi:DNA-3-methyladenine glycosylase I [Boudabousia marimammalium]|uniref:DNA-3-methyladenine glycosylase n=1 Tax=Boudabousia marimammalium TaxID=156892 RepID=A0A1Q5PLW9_9ACTO|nr:DNA-3-methyladenine glycosylase I [Boudabousia marimammalium]OKL48052.1 DNA-3-methyladenine glycosylase [Boudabousia marimammalium]
MRDELRRCDWATHSQIEQDYHDSQWGVPVFDDQELFQLLILEGMQAGLSWLTVLQKREAFSSAFDGFNPEIISFYDEAKEHELMQNSGIIRNRLKIRALSLNARAFLEVREQYGTFAAYVWNFVDGAPIINAWQSSQQVPTQTEISQNLSKDLKKRGFKFVGPTISYAFMQAGGLVNDHLLHCDFRSQSSRLPFPGS